MTRAWTLGYPPAYEKAVRIRGNSKAPGGYVFRTLREASAYIETHSDEAGRYRPYRVELPGPFEQCATRNFARAARARHDWHKDAREFMPECGVCIDHLDQKLDCHLLIVEAPFINPDTGVVTP